MGFQTPWISSQVANSLGGPRAGTSLTVAPSRTVHCNDKGVSLAHRIPALKLTSYTALDKSLHPFVKFPNLNKRENKTSIFCVKFCDG